jgi:hypothetical protein
VLTRPGYSCQMCVPRLLVRREIAGRIRKHCQQVAHGDYSSRLSRATRPRWS